MRDTASSVALHRPIAPRLARSGTQVAIVNSRAEGSAQRAATACRLALAIAGAAFNVEADAIRAAERSNARAVRARHVAIYLAHIVYQLPMQTVADVFGRDRTSIGHAVRRIEDRRDEPCFDGMMERLEALAKASRSLRASLETRPGPSGRPLPSTRHRLAAGHASPPSSEPAPVPPASIASGSPGTTDDHGLRPSVVHGSAGAVPRAVR